VFGYATETLPAYVDGVDLIVRSDQLADCQISIAVEPKNDPHLVAAANRFYPHHLRLRARTPGLLFWR
jgi:hypothetical protein